MDFKSYYHNRLNEEGNIDEPLDADAPVKEAPAPQKATGGAGIIGNQGPRACECDGGGR